jgi:hypothetical protein
MECGPHGWSGAAWAAICSKVQSPLVIAHTADLHSGKRSGKMNADGQNQRESDVYAALDVVSRYITDVVKPDVLVCAGDVWDGTVPSPTAARHGYDFFAVPREAGIPVIVIGGNHETLLALGRPTALEHLPRYFGVHLALEQQAFELEGVLFHCVPYRAVSNGALSALEPSREMRNVLIAHSNVLGSAMPADLERHDHTILPAAIARHEAIDLGMLGHIHLHQEIEQGAGLYYSGALERLTWDEVENDPSIYVHRLYENGTVETESIRVADMGTPLVPRPTTVLTVECAGLTAREAVEAAHAQVGPLDLEQHMVQIVFRDAPHDMNSVSYEGPLSKLIRDRGASVSRFKQIDSIMTVEEKIEEMTDERSRGSLAPGATIADRFSRFCSDRDTSEALRMLGAELIGAVMGEGDPT